MADTASDSIPVPEEQVPKLPQVPEAEIGLLKVGIFYADVDVAIAKRIGSVLKKYGCKSSLCDFYVGGKPTMDVIDSFVNEQQMVLWLATPASLGDKRVLEATRHIAQYACLASPELVRFVTIKPREYLNEKLPPTLGAYIALLEDDMFQERLDATIRSVNSAGVLEVDPSKSAKPAPPHGHGKVVQIGSENVTSVRQPTNDADRRSPDLM